VDRVERVDGGDDVVGRCAGTSNATIQSEVQGCGYTSARTAGGLSAAGPIYAESQPPKNVLALRAYAPSGQITLTNLEALVSGVLRRRLGPGRDPEGLFPDAGPSRLQHVQYRVGVDRPRRPHTFLNWVNAAGQPGGATPGTTFALI
jgi:hypothetical protein